VDAHPGRDRRKFVLEQLRRPNNTRVAGVGEAAYAFVSPVGFVNLTFLQADTLVTVSVAGQQGGIALETAKRLARAAAARVAAGPAGAAPGPAAFPPLPPAPVPIPPRPGLGPAVASSPPTGAVDPQLVGTWELFVPQATGQSRWVWEILPEGAYVFHDPVHGHQGAFEAAGGRFTMVSRTNPWRDQGNYQLSDPNTLVATGVLGTARWARVAQPPVLQTVVMGDQRIPARLPELVAKTLQQRAAPWRADAVLDRLEVERTKYGVLYVKMFFTSLSTGAGLRVEALPFELKTSEYKLTTPPLGMAEPPAFLDLPRVVQIVAPSGPAGSLARASMFFHVSRGQPGWRWELRSEGASSGTAVNAITGQVYPASRTGHFQGFAPPKDYR
jgi:hypothetical protein